MNLVLVLLALLIGLGCVGTLVGTRLIERRYPARGTFVAVDGGRLHVMELGAQSQRNPSAPPIVLLHGASGNLEDMRVALGEPLARRHRVILIDRPGHGWSDRSGGSGPEPARQAALVLQALDRMNIDRAIFVGHSWAGALVAALALDHPHRVAAIMLISAVTHPWRGGVSWYYNVAATPLLGRFFTGTVAVPLGSLMLRAGAGHVFTPQTLPVSYLEQAAIALVLRPRNFIANARDVAGLKAFVAAQAPRYGTIRVPTVLITGDSDDTVSWRIHSQALARAVPHAKLIVLPGIGHMPHHVATDIVVAEIDRLVRRI
jgi:pimeloyl-ACP methyl ester carboxylesterase